MVLIVQLALCKLEDNTDVVHVVEILAFESNHEIHFKKKHVKKNIKI